METFQVPIPNRNGQVQFQIKCLWKKLDSGVCYAFYIIQWHVLYSSYKCVIGVSFAAKVGQKHINVFYIHYNKKFMTTKSNCCKQLINGSIMQ